MPSPALCGPHALSLPAIKVRLREPFGSRPVLSAEGLHLGRCGLAADAAGGSARRLVRLPRLAGDLGVGMHGAGGGGKQSVGGEARRGGEASGTCGPGIEAEDALAVLVAIIVGEPGGEVAGLGDFAAVERSGTMRRADEGADDALKVDTKRRLVQCRLQRLGGEPDLLFGRLADAVVVHGVEGEAGGNRFGLDRGRGEPGGELEGGVIAWRAGGARAGFCADF